MFARPIAHAINRLAGDEVVLDEDQRAGDGRDGAALVLDHEFPQLGFELGAIDDAVEDGQRADIESGEGLFAGLGEAAGFTGAIFVRGFPLHVRECTREA